MSAAKKYLKKVTCVFAQELYGLLHMLFGIFVRSVEDGLEPSQTYDEVNKLLLQYVELFFRFLIEYVHIRHSYCLCCVDINRPFRAPI